MSILGKSYSYDLNGKKLKVFINPLVARSLSSVWLQVENTTVLVTLNTKPENKFLGFLPLTVDYEEKFYAVGKILGSRFLRREGRPSENAILNARLIDRSIRPKFSKFFFWPTHIVVTVFSFDLKNDPDILGIIGASLALAISPLPFSGPIAGTRIGIFQKEKIVNPAFDLLNQLDGELVFVGDGKLINMIEVKSNEINEDEVVSSAQIALQEIQKLIDFQRMIIEDQPKINKLSFDFSLPASIEEIVSKTLSKINFVGAENPNEYQIDKELLNNLNEEEKSLAEFLLKEKLKNELTNYVFEKKQRVDGRQLDEIRPLEMAAGIIPQVHGSGYFARGLTKIMSFVTLDSPEQQLTVKDIEFIGEKRFMHHYNFPPYSTGEVGSIKAPSRREIGHGMLAEKALSPLIPDLEEFPYAIRVVSEVLSSNGSTSMASVCASSLALLDAGVPLKRNVAGISIGLLTKDSDYLTLVDIQGVEDHYGEMDFKVAGTEKGITAIQMDVKNDGISLDILKTALEKAKKARLEILNKMNQTISQPNSLAETAPKITRLPINLEKIGLLIGSGGRTIHQLTEETESRIFIDPEKNCVYIIADNQEKLANAVERVKKIIEPKQYQIGDVLQGKIVKFFDFGVLVELDGGATALLHISNIPPSLKNLKNFGFQLNQTISVKIKEKDEMGRLSLVLA